jgi:hypothetical protein
MRTDLVSLASGAVIAALGALVLLDSSGALDVSLGWMAVALTGGVGAMLVVGGLAGTGDADARPARHD